MTKYKFDEIAINSTQKKKPTEEDKVYYIGLEHIDPGCFDVVRWGSDVAPTGDKLLMQKGDVLFGKRRAYQRKVAIAPFDGIFSAHGMVLRPNLKVIDANYFPFFISSDKFMETAVRMSVGGLSPTINWKDLARQEFELPSLDEQKVLADKLWAAYRLKEAYKKLLVATDEMVKSQFIEMFGNPFENNSEMVPLSLLCSINPSKPKGLDDSLSVSFIPMDRISEGGEYTEFETKPLKDVKKGFTFCAEDDVLFAKITPCMENGKGAILKGLSNGIGFGSTEFHVLRPIPGITNSEWLYFLTKLSGFRLDAAKNMTGTGGQKRVPSSYLLNFKVMRPQLVAQKEFAEIVRQADKSKFGDFKSQFIEMVGDPRNNPKGWPTKRLSELAEYSIGLTYKPEQICDDGTIVLRSGNIQDGKISFSDIVRVNAPIKESLFVKEDDILMCSRNGSASLVGKVAMIPDINEPMTFGAFMTIIRSAEAKYLYLYFQSQDFRERVSEGKSSTMNQITQKMLDKVEVPFPDKDVRETLSAIASQADKSKSVIQKALVYLNDIQSDELRKIA